MHFPGLRKEVHVVATGHIFLERPLGGAPVMNAVPDALEPLNGRRLPRA
jgi:hypothetical protein